MGMRPDSALHIATKRGVDEALFGLPFNGGYPSLVNPVVL